MTGRPSQAQTGVASFLQGLFGGMTSAGQRQDAAAAKQAYLEALYGHKMPLELMKEEGRNQRAGDANQTRKDIAANKPGPRIPPFNSADVIRRAIQQGMTAAGDTRALGDRMSDMDFSSYTPEQYAQFNPAFTELANRAAEDYNRALQDKSHAVPLFDPYLMEQSPETTKENNFLWFDKTTPAVYGVNPRYRQAGAPAAAAPEKKVSKNAERINKLYK